MACVYISLSQQAGEREILLLLHFSLFFALGYKWWRGLYIIRCLPVVWRARVPQLSTMVCTQNGLEKKTENTNKRGERKRKKKTIKFHRLPGRSQWLSSMRSHTVQTGGSSPSSTRAWPTFSLHTHTGYTTTYLPPSMVGHLHTCRSSPLFSSFDPRLVLRLLGVRQGYKVPLCCLLP